VRPLRVELEGVGSFRAPTTLDLVDVDLFALAGPTGAGKTTLLDAIVLALYGSIPRYDDRRLVAPIINQGANEGRVRLTFAVGDRLYAATRVVRRTKAGATTKEARLEDVTGGGSHVLAGTADELTSAVGDLLGLSFEQFCRSVVLPQGAFDRFLFARPAERADLLVQLLDLGLHTEIGKRARARATEAAARADAADRRLQGDLAGIGPGARDALAARVEALDALAGRCRGAQDELDQLKEQGSDLRVRADAAAADRDALQALHRPDDVDDLAASTRAALETQREAGRRRAEAADAVDTAETVREALPDATVLDILTRAGDEHRAAETALPALATAADEATTEATTAAAAVERAAAEVAAARVALEAARRRELVHAITDGVHAGDDCPVCGTTLATEPDRGDGTESEEATAALQAADAAHRSATTRQREADRSAATATERHQAGLTRARSAERALAEARRVAGVTDDATTAELLERVRAADDTLRTARDRERVARREETEATATLERARQRETAGWAVLDRARDGVARLGPPATDRSDLAAAWDSLLAWAHEARPAAVAAADDAAAAVLAARERYRGVERRVRDDCDDVGVDVPDGTAPQVAVADALATARARLQSLTDRLAEVTEVTRTRDEAREQAQVAEHLGRLLRADGFERWLLARALTQLVEGASGLLRELTSGAYSLCLDATNQFLVVDHRNADEPRTVRSLSGGERFLASLALALALAEHVAELAADGAARLESLFLDEGFGTLDPDTLDVVAAALEELGARGRMVGVITHVRDLAERLPVRFEVQRGPAGSTVARVDVAGDAVPAAGLEDVDGTVTDEDAA
jgi:DNA repair protein SbcC/Rad50